MLTVLGFAMIATFLVLIMTKKMSPIAALVLIPALFCVAVGQGHNSATTSSTAWRSSPPPPRCSCSPSSTSV